MKEYLFFIHSPEDPMVSRVGLVHARSRREALRKLQKMGFRKRKF